MSQLQRLQQQQAAYDAATREVRDLVASVTDDSSFVEFNAFLMGTDRLDGNPIAGEGVLCGTATVNGAPIVVIAQNSAVLYGSVGAATAAKIAKAIDFACANVLPIVSILDSSGARILDGVAMLEGYGTVLDKLQQYASVHRPHIAIVKGQAVGLMAVYAALCDVRIALPQAVVCVNAPKVLAAGDLRSDCGAAAVAAAGGVDFVCADTAAVCASVQSLLCWFDGALSTQDDPNREADLAAGWDADALFAAVLDEDALVEFRADAAPAARCVLGFVGGKAVALSFAQGTLDAACARKIAAFWRFAAKASATVISMVDSIGFADGDQVALANALADLARCATPDTLAQRIGVAVGSAIGSVYTLLLSKGIGFAYTLAFADAVIAPLAPDGAVQVVYRNTLHEAGNSPEQQAKLQAKYAAEQGDAFAAAAAGYVDAVIDPDTLRPYLANALNMLF